MAGLTDEFVRIFVNARPVDAAPNETVLSAIARWDAGIAAQLERGERALADSRGLVAPLDTVVYGGAIYRVVSARQLHANDDPFADV